MLRIQLLGPVEAFADDAALALGGPKQRTVLATLAIDPGKRVSTDRLVEAVWGDDVPERASRSISTYVSNLRGILGDVIARDGNGYSLRLGRDQVDATLFADRVAASQRNDSASGLRKALELWAGTPFGGVDGHHVLEPEITRLTELRIAAAESAIEADLAADVDVDLIELDRLISAYPHRERIRGLHMRALYSAGRQAEALTSYKSFRDQLATDLGIDPSPELQQLELQILQQDPELSPRRPSPASSDIGSLPVRYSSFVGREDEIASVSAAIAADRLVTVVGPGGIGKSSLVVEAARLPEVHRGEPVVRVVIDSLDDSEVLPSLAAALGLSPAPGLDPVDVIAGYTSSRSILLILDGCEPHLEFVPGVINRVLSSSPQVRVLATSREPLGLAGEAAIRVGGLDRGAAAKLFLERAKLGADVGHESLDKVQDICSTLDGMPLAVELAAARLRSVPLNRLVERLDDMIPLLAKSRSTDERHGSIASAIAWSYDLLEADEQRALRWLSVYPTGFTRQDAAAMLEDRYAEDTVARLVDVSLVQPADESRLHRMLEPVRQYGEHLLTNSGEQHEAGLCHALWVVAELRRTAAEAWSVRFRDALGWRIERSLEIDRAFGWAHRHDQPQLVVDMLAAIGNRTFPLSVASPAMVEAAVPAVEDPSVAESGDLAVAMVRTASAVANLNRVEEAMSLLDRAEETARLSDDKAALGDALVMRAVILNLVDSSALEPIDLVDEAIRCFEAAGTAETKDYLLRRAVTLARMGHMDEAIEDLLAYEAWATSVRGRPEWNTIGWKGRLARLQGDRHASMRFDRDLTEVARANLDFWLEQNMWESYAVDAAFLGDEQLMAEAMEKLDDVHERTGIPISAFVRARVASVRGHHDEVLAVAAEWFAGLMGLMKTSDVDRAALIGMEVAGDATREPNFFEILLPVGLALEATGRAEDARQIAREASSLMELSNFKHWDEMGETQLWVELLTRLGNGEPNGLTLDEGFAMVHDILVANSVA